MAFRIGQRVVCIGGPWLNIGLTPWECPSLGAVYVVRSIFPWPNNRGASCRLVEIRNEPVFDGFEPAFSVEFFRPVVSTGTDTGMAILEQIRRDVTDKTALPIREDEQV